MTLNPSGAPSSSTVAQLLAPFEEEEEEIVNSQKPFDEEERDNFGMSSPHRVSVGDPGRDCFLPPKGVPFDEASPPPPPLPLSSGRGMENFVDADVRHSSTAMEKRSIYRRSPGSIASAAPTEASSSSASSSSSSPVNQLSSPTSSCVSSSSDPAEIRSSSSRSFGGLEVGVVSPVSSQGLSLVMPSFEEEELLEHRLEQAGASLPPAPLLTSSRGRNRSAMESQHERPEAMRSLSRAREIVSSFLSTSGITNVAPSTTTTTTRFRSYESSSSEEEDDKDMLFHEKDYDRRVRLEAFKVLERAEDDPRYRAKALATFRGRRQRLDNGNNKRDRSDSTVRIPTKSQRFNEYGEATLSPRMPLPAAFADRLTNDVKEENEDQQLKAAAGKSLKENLVEMQHTSIHSTDDMIVDVDLSSVSSKEPYISNLHGGDPSPERNLLEYDSHSNFMEMGRGLDKGAGGSNNNTVGWTSSGDSFDLVGPAMRGGDQFDNMGDQANMSPYTTAEILLAQRRRRRSFLVAGLGLVVVLGVILGASLASGESEDDTAMAERNDGVLTSTKQVGDVVSFYVTANVPMNIDENNILARRLTSLPSPTSDNDYFFVHLGDVSRASSSACTEEVYKAASDLLQLAPCRNVFVVPGNNDWNECPNPDEAWNLWNQYLGRFNEKSLTPVDDSQSSINIVSRQLGHDENFSFLKDGVLFLGLNIVSGTVYPDHEHFARRMEQAVVWTQEVLARTPKSRYRAMVIMGHGNPSLSDQNLGTYFGSLVSEIRKQHGAHVPVLYLHAPEKYVQTEISVYRPFRRVEDTLEAVRVSPGGAEGGLLKVTVNFGDDPFVVETQS